MPTKAASSTLWFRRPLPTIATRSESCSADESLCVRNRVRTRFTLLRLTFALSIITYIDRVCISTAAPDIRESAWPDAGPDGLGLQRLYYRLRGFRNPERVAWRHAGPRKVLTRIVLWWSAFTMATGAVWNYVSLLIARFLFGAGEAGAFPNMSRSLSRWFPLRERGRLTDSSSWDRGWAARSRHCLSGPSSLSQDGDRPSGFSDAWRRLVRVLVEMVSRRSRTASRCEPRGTAHDPGGRPGTQQPDSHSASCSISTSCGSA